MKLNWRQATVYATIMGMEGCALYVLLTLLNIKAADGRLSIIAFMLLYPLAFVFNKVLQWLRWPGVLRYSVNSLAWIIVMLLMVKTQLFSQLGLSDSAWLLALPQAITNLLHAFEPALLILLGSAVAWWLGWRLAHIWPGFATSLTEFQFGLVTILIVFFFASQLDVQMDNSILITLAFFIFALLGVSLAHAQEGTGWLTGLHQGNWAGLLLVSIGLILILGLAISSVVTPDFLQVILAALRWVGGLIMRAIAFLLNLLPEPGPIEPIPGMNMTGAEPSENVTLWTIPEPILSGLRLGWTILISGLILGALWRLSSEIFAWLRRRLTTMGDAEIEPMPGAFRADILGFLKRVLRKLLGLKLPARRQNRPEPPGIVSTRQIYRQLLKWAADHGWRRPVSQTPYEYLGTLESLLPAYTDAFRVITQCYVSARYGLLPPSAEELPRLKQSWHQISHYRPGRPDSQARKPT